MELQNVNSNPIKQETISSLATLPVASTQNLINFSALDDHFPGKEDFIRKILTRIHKNYKEIQPKLHAAIEQNDMESLTLLAHSVKGSSGNIMALPVFELANMTENSAREKKPNSLDLAIELVDKLSQLNRIIARRVA